MTVYECTILGLCKRMATGRLGGLLFQFRSSPKTSYLIDLILEANSFEALAGSVSMSRNDHYMETENIQVSVKLILHSSIPVASTIVYGPSLS